MIYCSPPVGGVSVLEPGYVGAAITLSSAYEVSQQICIAHLLCARHCFKHLTLVVKERRSLIVYDGM